MESSKWVARWRPAERRKRIGRLLASAAHSSLPMGPSKRTEPARAGRLSPSLRARSSPSEWPFVMLQTGLNRAQWPLARCTLLAPAGEVLPALCPGGAVVPALGRVCWRQH